MYEELTRLQKKHRLKAAEMLADSFFDNPLFIYLFPQEGKRKRILQNVYRSTVEIVDAISDTYVTSDRVEGIFAVRRTGYQSFSPALYIAILKTIFRSLLLVKDVQMVSFIKKARRLSVISKRMTFYEKQKPHLVLDMVAVDKKYRGQKYMSQMIRAALKEADIRRTFCVLETETTRNVRIYEHFGFQLSQSVEVIKGQLTVYILVYDPHQQIIYADKS
ncbi:GNAT family N-acetyltransferase [Metabacillus idriensis]|uniref:GNAT family N-acetyltransferase n=1 Tax=Metabacillus idriensis TaxID=324768 RepID=UPI003D289642